MPVQDTQETRVRDCNADRTHRLLRAAMLRWMLVEDEGEGTLRAEDFEGFFRAVRPGFSTKPRLSSRLIAGQGTA